MILPVLLWALMIAVVIAGWPLVALTPTSEITGDMVQIGIAAY